MKLRLIAVGTRMPAWVETGFRDYAERMPRELRLELVEIPVAQRGRNPDIARLKQQEGERMLKAAGERNCVIALDERGRSWSSPELAERVAQWQLDGRDVDLLVGGPDGLAPDCLQRAEARWSLSALTLPHALVRVLVAEQLYRAWSLLANHPYHRA